MSRYGLPYQGNKSKIAEDIIFALPSGQRLVDLFGGGGAITHCALLSGKWQEVLYNDINSVVVDFFIKVVNGEYDIANFKPEFITRERFFAEKEQDGYIKYLWSFGNDGDSYMFGQDIEEYKHAVHNAIVFEDYSLTDKLGIDTNCLKQSKEQNWRKRMKIWRRYISTLPNIERHNNHLYIDGVNVESQMLQQLEQLQRLQQLQTSCISYTDYVYRSGDIVYCDIPYEQKGKGTCNDYSKENIFDNIAFYEWAKTREYPVYFSSYEISDKDFECVWEKDLITTMGTGNACKRTERLYVNKYGTINKQLSFI